MIAQETYEIEVAHNRRSERLQHLELRVEIVLEQPLVRTTRLISSLLVHRTVEIDRYRMRMVHGTDEEIEGILGEDALHQLQCGWTDILRFEADQDLDLS